MTAVLLPASSRHLCRYRKGRQPVLSRRAIELGDLLRVEILPSRQRLVDLCTSGFRRRSQRLRGLTIGCSRHRRKSSDVAIKRTESRLTARSVLKYSELLIHGLYSIGY